jgi:hypothetical protein
MRGYVVATSYSTGGEIVQADELMNGARILSLLHKSKNWNSLCRHFGLKPSTFKTDTLTNTLYKHLEKLRELGLVEFKGNTKEMEAISGPIKISKQWTEIQTALGHPPLAGIARLASSDNGIVVSPTLGRPTAPSKPADLFVLMPFTEELKPVFENHIRKIGKRLKISVRRGDDIFTVKPVMDKIWGDIYSARMILADCTGRNANVFYELGLAHIVGKPVVLITKNKDDMPFDIKHIEYIEYKYDPEGVRVFERKLAEVLRKELKLPVMPRKTAAKQAGAKKRGAAKGPARKRRARKR